MLGQFAWLLVVGCWLLVVVCCLLFVVCYLFGCFLFGCCLLLVVVCSIILLVAHQKKGKQTWDNETNTTLNLSTRQSRFLVQFTNILSLLHNGIKHMVHIIIQNAHGGLGQTNMGMDLEKISENKGPTNTPNVAHTCFMTLEM